MRNKTYYLIEAVAENMARELLLKFRKVKAITLEIKKPWAPIGVNHPPCQDYKKWGALN